MKKLMLVTFCALVVYYFVKSLEVEKEKTSLSYETATNVNTKSNRSFKLNENTGEEVSSIKALQKNKVNNLPPNKKISKIKNNESKSISFNIDTAFESSVYHSKFLNNYRDGNYKEAIKLGNNILKIPKKYASHYWYGNICHSTNIILGKIYFAMGDTEKAERFLLKSVDKEYIENSRGKIFSPQLSSFGPDRSLAYDLYKKGLRDGIIEYFEKVRVFWKSGVEDGIIERAINNIKTPRNEDLIYLEEDDPSFPFKRVEYVIDYNQSPIKESSD